MSQKYRVNTFINEGHLYIKDKLYFVRLDACATSELYFFARITAFTAPRIHFFQNIIC